MKFHLAYFLTLLLTIADPSKAVYTATCFNGTIKAAGSTVVYPFADKWATSFKALCSKANVTLFQGGTTAGAKRVCGDTTLGPVDIGMLAREWKSTEATKQSDGYTFNCLIGNTTRQVAQIAVDNDAAVFIVKADPPSKPAAPKQAPVKPAKPAPSKPVPSKPVAITGPPVAGCISKLGSLSKDQLRWIYSNYTVSQLKQSGWKNTSLPNSDGNDSTHLWSELDSDCPKTEVLIVGTGSDSTFGEWDFARTTILTNATEGYRSAYVAKTNRSAVNDYVVQNFGAIGFNNFVTGLSTSTTKAVAIKNPTSGAAVVPSASTVQDGSYSPFSRVTYMNVLKNNCTALKSGINYVEYGLSPNGQANVSQAGGVPLTTAQISVGTTTISALRSYTGCT